MKEFGKWLHDLTEELRDKNDETKNESTEDEWNKEIVTVDQVPPTSAGTRSCGFGIAQVFGDARVYENVRV